MRLIDADYSVKVLNPSAPHLSEGYNPLLRAGKSESEIQKISKMVVINALGTGSKDPFWNIASEGLISLMTKFVIANMPKENHSLYTVYTLISALGYAPDKIDRLMVKAHPDILREYKSYISYGDKVLSSVIATCRSALSLFATDPMVALTTSHDTIDFSSFKKQKQALFINTSTKDMRYYSLFTSLFLEQFFGEIMSHLPTKNNTFPVFFLADEASSIYFNNLQITVSNIRKYNSGILQIYQSISQLIDLYGQSIAKAISENSYTKIFMSGQPIHVAQELETTLGKFEWTDEENNNRQIVRPLMTASEIHQSDKSIILCGHYPAIKTAITPYFKQAKMRHLSELSPYQPENKLPFTTLPSIQFIDE